MELTIRQEFQATLTVEAEADGPSEEDIRRSREVGFLEHMTKPVNFGKLHAAIERLLTE